MQPCRVRTTHQLLHLRGGNGAWYAPYVLRAVLLATRRLGTSPDSVAPTHSGASHRLRREFTALEPPVTGVLRTAESERLARVYAGGSKAKNRMSRKTSPRRLLQAGLGVTAPSGTAGSSFHRACPNPVWRCPRPGSLPRGPRSSSAARPRRRRSSSCCCRCE